MRKVAAVMLGVIGLGAAALFFLLNTTAGLRWTVDQALSLAGVPVEIGELHGRLLGPVSLAELSYRDPDNGTRVRIEAIELDWHAHGLLGGQLHVTRLHVSGVEYTPASPTETQEPSLPEISLPLAVQVDELRLDGLAIAGESGAGNTIVEHASLRGSIDAEAALLENVVVDAGDYSIDRGRIRLDLGAGMPLEASLDWRAALPELPVFSGGLQVDGALGETLNPVFEVKAPFAAHGRGTVSDLLDTPRWTLTASLPELVALDSVLGTLPPLAIRGDIQAEGDTGQARLAPDLSLVYQGTEATLTGEIDVSREAVQVRRARLARADGSDAVDFSGRLALAGDWSVTANVPEAVALDGIMPGLPPVAVRGDIQAQGDTGEARVSPDISLLYRDMEAALTGEIEVSPKAVVVERARLARANSPDTVNLSGRVELSESLPFTVQGNWQSLQGPGDAAWSSASGEFKAEGDKVDVTAAVSGVITPPGQSDESPIELDVQARALDRQPEITGTAHLPYFAYGDIAARDIDVAIDFRSAGETASDARIKAAGIRIAGREATGIDLHVNGTPARHEISLTGEFDGWAVDAGVAGSYEDVRWVALLERFTATPPADFGDGEWVLAQPTELVWSPDRSELEELCLRNSETRACANGFFADAAQWHVTAGVTGVSLQELARDTPEALRIEGTLEAHVDIGNSGDGIAGEASAGIERATIAWQAEDPVTTEYRDVALTATLTPDELRARLEGRLDESGSIQGQLVTRDPLADDGALSGNISARLPSLRVIQAAVPQLGLRQGKAMLELSVDGTRSEPRLSGDARIEQAVLAVAPIGIRLNDLNLVVRGEDSRRLNIETRAASGEGTLRADGFVEWPSGGGWRSEIAFTGEEAELVRLPQALIEGSPDLRIEADETGGTVEGRVRITRAELTPEAGRPRVTLSDDIVIKGEDGEPRATQNPMAWHARVAVELGDNVRFKGYGAEGRLAGEFNIDAPSQQPVRANGNIQIHDGKYEYYGRRFDITRGRLVYTGGPVDNPGIDIEVVKEVREVSVSMAVTGPAADPDLQLTSTPAMSETDKMSYLLLGRPASQASGAEAGLLLRAAASMMPGGGGRGVPDRIQSTLGLDTLEVRTDDPEAEGAAVELGKYLAPDLYVSYVAGFQQAVDIFRVRYELARHWLLQAESSTRGSGGDLLFTW